MRVVRTGMHGKADSCVCLCVCVCVCVCVCQELERINSSVKASLQSALVLNQDRVKEYEAEIMQHQRLASGACIRATSLKKFKKD